MTEYVQLQNALKYHFKDIRLLINALTHPSMIHERNNQRLEFLGDAVLQLSVSDILYRTHTNVQEGSLTNLRQHLVCQDALAKAARELELGMYLRMDRGCEAGGGRNNDSVLCDAMEAVLAAIYLDSGYPAAKKVIEELLPLQTTEEFSDNKSTLQQLLQKDGRPQPRYEIISQSGPDHNKLFCVAVISDEKTLGEGSGTSKKRAEQNAAAAALKKLKAQTEAGRKNEA